MIVVFCTTPDKKTASKIAKVLVEEGDAACVNIIKVDETVYKWEGKLVRGKEHLMVIKARKESWDTLKKKIENIHPYSVPEIVSVKTHKVAEPYLDWVYCGAKSAGQI
jgi:periplasmic divalent cation tolerance protein